MAEPEVVYFNDPDKGREGTRITNKEKRKLRQGDVDELFTLSHAVTSGSNTNASSSAKTWSKSDLTVTIRQVSALADKLTRQMEAKKMETKTLPRRQKRVVKSYPEVQKEKKEMKLKAKEEQGVSDITTVTDKKGKQNTKKRRGPKGRGRWRDNIKGLDPPVGRFRNGILSLSKKDVKKISKSSK